MNRSIVKDGIIYKYPISDYIRVSVIALVVLVTVVAVKMIALLSRLKGSRKNSFDIYPSEQ